MQINKAIITAAGRGVRVYPAADPVQKAMLPLVDRDGVAKPVLQIIAEEALAGGVEEICVVCAPGDEEQYLRQFRALHDNLLAAYQGVEWARVQAEQVENLLRRLHFVVQADPLGYGHAVWCARAFTHDEPFLLLLSDHLCVAHTPAPRCAEQVIALATRHGCAVSAVQATRESQIGNYGTLSATYLSTLPGVYQIERIIEKPSVTQAELELLTPGLRAGFYFCFWHMGNWRAKNRRHAVRARIGNIFSQIPTVSVDDLVLLREHVINFLRLLAEAANRAACAQRIF